jgi:hypothetical protein
MNGHCHTWTHGGKPWSFWQKSGQFLYVFGEAHGDACVPSPFAEAAIKIGVTTDPKVRLQSLRSKTPHGIWRDITWMESSAVVTEKALHELLNPWRCGFEREWFCLPLDVEEWLFEGMADSWSKVAKHHRLYGETVRSIITEIMPTYYSAKWIEMRIANLNAL